MSLAQEEAYRRFSETLQAELVQNVKPVIISLTMLAEDYSENSVYVAKAIEEYITKIQPEIKILGLYLMDSIMKNLRDTDYIQIFEKNIVIIFCRVFNAVDEANRKALYKLRKTWNDIFTNRTLYDIDVRVQKIDPAWPITAIREATSHTPSPPPKLNISTKISTTPSTVAPGPRDPRLAKQTPLNHRLNHQPPSMTKKSSPPKPTLTISSLIDTALSSSSKISSSTNNNTSITSPLKQSNYLKRASSSDLQGKIEMKKPKVTTSPPTTTTIANTTDRPNVNVTSKPSAQKNASKLATTSATTAATTTSPPKPSVNADKGVKSIVNRLINMEKISARAATTTPTTTTNVSKVQSSCKQTEQQQSITTRPTSDVDERFDRDVDERFFASPPATSPMSVSKMRPVPCIEMSGGYYHGIKFDLPVQPYKVPFNKYGDNKNDPLLIAKQRENMFSKPPPPLPKPAYNVLPGGGAPDVNEIFKMLVKTGLIPTGSQPPGGGKPSDVMPPPIRPKIPDLTSMESELLKQNHQGAIERLYLVPNVETVLLDNSRRIKQQHRQQIDTHDI